MTFENYKTSDNAESSFLGDISASVETIILKAGEGALFPTEFPFLGVGEKFNTNTNPQIIGREIMKVIGSVATDTFTVIRQFAECVQDETITPKVKTNNPQTFSSGDKFSLYVSSIDDKNLKDEVIRLETDKLDTATYNAEKPQKGSSTTGNDSYQATISTVSSYINGQRYLIEVDVSNTGNATFEANALGAKAIKIGEGGVFIDIPTNTITAGGFMNLTYIATGDFFQYTDDPGNVSVSSASSTQSEVILGESVSAGDALYKDIDNKAYLTDASDSSKTNFIGFASESGVLDDVIKLNTAGVDGNQTFLEADIGKHVYLSQPSSVVGISQTSSNFDGRFSGGSFGQTVTLLERTKINSFYQGSTAFDNNGIVVTCNVYDGIGGTLLGTADSTYTTVTGFDYMTFTFTDLVVDAGLVYFEFEKAYTGSSSWHLYVNTANAYTGGEYIKEGVAVSGQDLVFTLSGETDYAGIGKVSTTPGTNVVKVGQAVSETEIKMEENIDSLNGVTSTSATAGAITPPNITGYITIKVNGVDRKIAYYGV